jgi:hypothetical protein
MPSASPRTATAARWRRILPAALCAAALSAALIVPAIASAEPKKYDPDAEANCEGAAASRYLNGEIGKYEYIGQVEECCIDNGGIPDDHHVCHAVADVDVRPGQVRPGLTPSPGVTLQPATPTSAPPPAARNLPTFTPSTG